MGRHGVRAEMNGNGERWADFCQTNELVIGEHCSPIRIVTNAHGHYAVEHGK